jgi:uncharacterized protein YcaQ
MSIPAITSETARHLLLQAQGLAHLPQQPAEKSTVVDAIRDLRFLQIDTINIVARSPYLALFSRIGDYDLSWVNESLVEKNIFEYWAHAACFLPIEDYPYHRRLMLEKLRLPHYHRWYAEHKEQCDDLLKHIHENGPVRSADFERQDGRKGSWWDWKFEKDALEFWFCAGELMVPRREKFQRVYDLRERVLPDWRDTDAPSLEETIRFLVLQSVRGLGLCKREWVADYFRLACKPVETAIAELLKAGAIVEVAVESWPQPGLMVAESLPLLEGKRDDLIPTLTSLLSPFDSLICDRKRMQALFNFDFTIECYLPSAKRKYGYFLLPILHRGQLVGRLDAKAHRKEGIFEVKGLFWEPGLTADKCMLKEVGAAIQRCADWHGTPTVEIRNCVPDNMTPC